jgi:tetratricopeptide (TPR) repeat protein
MRWIQILLSLAAAVGVWVQGRGAFPAAGRLAEEAEGRLENTDPRAGAEAELFRQALARDSASPYRWCDLGETLAAAGHGRQAEYCFRRAVELGPNLPPVLMRAANYHLLGDESRRALAETSRILALVREYDGAIFGLYRRLEVPAADVIEYGLPAHPPSRAALFEDTLANGTVQEAGHVWALLEREGQAGDAAATKYAGFLLARHAYREAGAAWRRRFGLRDPEVFNGGFETTPLGGGLDWRIDPVEGVEAGRDATERHRGASSLRLSFQEAGNVAYHHVTGHAIVSGGVYRFSAFVKASALTTDQGIRLRLRDADSPALLDVSTRQVAGTTGWEETALLVRIPPGLHLVEIVIVREPSLKFDNKIRGSVWIDDVSLSPAASADPGND